MCEFKKWLQIKYYGKNIDDDDYNYWCNRMAEAYVHGEKQAVTTIIEDWQDGFIELCPSDIIILKAFKFEDEA